jgi:hypothetical protein
MCVISLAANHVGAQLVHVGGKRTRPHLVLAGGGFLLVSTARTVMDPVFRRWFESTPTALVADDHARCWFIMV